jgi:uncharacterized membrane protein YhaH (DUF805 family)
MTDTTTAAPLSAPLYGATFGQAITRFFKKYGTFSGRASRSEFWWWYLFYAIVSGVLYGIAATVGAASATVSDDGTMVVFGPGFWIAGIPYMLWALATIVPWLALAWRRLHDTNRSGGFYFLGLIPLVGGIILLVFFLLPSDPAGARFDR